MKIKDITDTQEGNRICQKKLLKAVREYNKNIAIAKMDFNKRQAEAQESAKRAYFTR